MGGWLGLIGSLLGRNKAAPAPLQAPQLTGQPVTDPALQQARPQAGGFGQMLGACGGPNPPMWCPKPGVTGSPAGTPPATSAGAEGMNQGAA